MKIIKGRAPEKNQKNLAKFGLNRTKPKTGNPEETRKKNEKSRKNQIDLPVGSRQEKVVVT